MTEELDFSNAKQGAVIDSGGKTRITIMLDTHIINSFRDLAEKKGVGYQTEINRVLREFLSQQAALSLPSTLQEWEALLRKVVREEVHSELHAA